MRGITSRLNEYLPCLSCCAWKVCRPRSTSSELLTCPEKEKSRGLSSRERSQDILYKGPSMLDTIGLIREIAYFVGFNEMIKSRKSIFSSKVVYIC